MTGAGAERRALAFVFVTVALNAVGIGLVMPVMPTLLIELSGDSGIGRAAAWGGIVSLGYALMQFLMSPALGNLSDAHGRRPVLLVSLLVMGVDYLAMATTGSLGVLILARLVAGAAAATFSTANAYIADVTPPERRGANFGLVGAAFGLGFIAGPALGGALAELGSRAPFWAAAGLAFANLAFGLAALPESLPVERRRPFRLARANPVGAMLAMLRRPEVAWLLAALFVYNVAHYVWPAIWSYFATARFGWGPGEIGLSLAWVGVGFVVAQGVLIRRIIPRFGAGRTAMAALGLDAAVFLAMAFATAGWEPYALMPATALAALFAPALQSLMSNRTPSDAQGELQGAVAALTALATVVTPLLMTQLFFAFTAPGAPVFFPGAPFLAAAAISALAFLPLLAGLGRSGGPR